MNGKSFLPLTWFVLLIAVTIFGAGHHTFSGEFDTNQRIELTGNVTKIDWSYPNVWISIDVKDETGKATNWSWACGPPSALIVKGWSRTTLKRGDLVTMEGNRAKDGSLIANATKVSFARKPASE